MGYDTLEEALAYENFKKNWYNTQIIHPTSQYLVGNNLKGKSVIDLACGSGYSTKFLADLEPDKLIGIDLSEKMVDLANKFYNNHANQNYSKIKFFVGDCRK